MGNTTLRGGILKNFGKALAMIGVASAAIGGGMYMMMQNPKTKKTVGKTMLKAMDNTEAMIAKKMG